MIDIIEDKIDALRDEFDLALKALLTEISPVLKMGRETQEKALFPKSEVFPDHIRLTCQVIAHPIDHDPVLTYKIDGQELKPKTLLTALTQKKAATLCRSIGVEPEVTSLYALNHFEGNSYEISNNSSLQWNFWIPEKQLYGQEVILKRGETSLRTLEGREGYLVSPLGAFYRTDMHPDDVEQHFFGLARQDDDICLDIYKTNFLRDKGAEHGIVMDFNLQKPPITLGASLRAGALKISVKQKQSEESRSYLSTGFRQMPDRPEHLEVTFALVAEENTEKFKEGT